MLVANEYQIPDECPENCSFKGGNTHQGSTCSRCPVFCCREFEYEGQMERILEPHEYRSDWALAWYIFFKTGKHPELYL